MPAGHGHGDALVRAWRHCVPIPCRNWTTVVPAALWWLFFRPITGLLEERERRVRKSLLRAEEIEEQAAAAEAARAELLAAAHAEAREVRARAEQQAQRLLVRARAQAREEADRILGRAANIAASRGDGSGGPNGRDSSAAVAAAIAGAR